MLQNSSITQGGLRVASPNGILAQSVAGGGPAVRVTGLQIVDGVLRITGTIDGDGDFEWSGSIDQEGATNLRGPVAITGQSGTLTVDAETLLRGVTRMLADLRVENDGKITAGSMTIDPSANGGSVKFSGGPEIYADGAQLSLYSGTGAFIELNGEMAKINGPGARWIEVNSAGVRFVALPTGAPAGAKAVVMDPATGQLYRAT